MAKAIGRRVFFSWMDGDEKVVVDTEEEFEDLLVELDEDWNESCELHGEMKVEIVELSEATGEVSTRIFACV